MPMGHESPTRCAMAIIKLNPDPEEFLDAENEFLRAIGECVTGWAFIDRQLFRLYRFGLGAPTHTAAIIYFEQNTIGQQLHHINNLLQAALTQPQYEKFKKLHKKIKDLLPVRNAIAHHPVKRTGVSREGKAVYVYAIYPEPYRRHLRKEPKVKELLTEDLKRHAAEVRGLEVELKTFVRALTHKGNSAI